jgi:hypothetical protein
MTERLALHLAQQPATARVVVGHELGQFSDNFDWNGATANQPAKFRCKIRRKEWRRVESNHGPRDYETLALAN